jgi:hypothetical protein
MLYYAVKVWLAAYLILLKCMVGIFLAANASLAVSHTANSEQ